MRHWNPVHRRFLAHHSINVALATTADPGSFRDRNGTVYHRNGEILRGISAAALANWERLSAAPFLREAMERGSIVRTERLDDAATRSLGGDWAAVLRHEAVPFISYPYEWTFGMLQDAALLHLDLMLAALPAGLILKDASAYNIQWRGAEPVFIDIPSFETLPTASRGSATGSSASCSSTPCSCRPIRASTSAPGCAARSTASPPRPCVG